MRINTELFNEIVDDIESYIPKLSSASQSIGDLFYEPLTDEGSQLFSQYVTGISNLIQTVMMTLTDAEDHAPAMIQPVTTSLVGITNKISELEKALEIKEYIHAADILKYEMVEQLDSLLQVIEGSR